MSSVTISGNLIAHTRDLYHLSLKEIFRSKVWRRGINGYTHFAYPAYITAAAAVEAFINESFLSFPYRHFFSKNSPLWNLGTDWIEKLELSKKIILVPQLLFNYTIRKDGPPYQDMATLIKIRNDLVHYKMKPDWPKWVAPLAERKIFLKLDDQYKDSASWPEIISCSEGIRWAHNTACNMAHCLINLIPIQDYKEMLITFLDNFKLIDESEVIEWVKTKGMDPDSNYP